jgi:hypothetical protein
MCLFFHGEKIGNLSFTDRRRLFQLWIFNAEFSYHTGRIRVGALTPHQSNPAPAQSWEVARGKTFPGEPQEAPGRLWTLLNFGFQNYDKVPFDSTYSHPIVATPASYASSFGGVVATNRKIIRALEHSSARETPLFSVILPTRDKATMLSSTMIISKYRSDWPHTFETARFVGGQHQSDKLKRAV